MSKGSLRVASSELESVQPHLGDGRSAGYAYPERGLDRNSLRKGPLAHVDLMGTSQQLGSAPRKGETLDMIAGRDLVSPRPASVRPSSNYGGSGPPVVVASHHATRALTRPPPPPPSAPFGAVLSPRTYHGSSYRDAALVAAQHGLSAYAQSASAVAAAAAASRALTPRSFGGGASGCGGAVTANPGRPPPAPRPTQHSAPTPMACPPNGAEFLPSCRAASPCRGSGPPTRSGFLPSRGSAPPAPGSPGRGGGDAAAAAAAAAAVPSHRSGDLATVTVTYNDLWWRGAFDGLTEADDSMVGSAGGAARPVSGSTAGAIRVMSPGWGAAPPSVFEADGRPGTRGGGPQYDMDGRPMTRGGQRPPSRAQLIFSHQRPPAYVAPLGGPGWAGLFAGGCGTVSGETAAGQGSGQGALYASPRAPSAGASLGWSGDNAEPAPAGSHRRQLMPLMSPALAGSAGAAARIGSPPARGVGVGVASGAGGGVLASLPPAPASGLLPASSPSRQETLPPSAGQLPLPSGVGVNGGSCSSPSTSIGTNGNGGVTAGGTPGTPSRPQLAAKLGSIAESPGSPTLLPLPPQFQRHSQPQPQPQTTTAKDLMVRMDSGGGRKASREREASFTSLVADPSVILSLGLPGGGHSEEGSTDDSYHFNLDQDAAGRGASGRARLRRNSASMTMSMSMHPTAAPGGYRGHGPLSGDLAGVLAQGAAGGGSPSEEGGPPTRPRR